MKYLGTRVRCTNCFKEFEVLTSVVSHDGEFTNPLDPMTNAQAIIIGGTVLKCPFCGQLRPFDPDGHLYLPPVFTVRRPPKRTLGFCSFVLV